MLEQEAIRTAVVESIAQLTKSSAQGMSDDNDLVDDLGVDSLNAVNLLVAVEDRLGIMLPEGSEASLAGVRTVGELVARLGAAFALDVAEVQAPNAPEASAR
jgi:acyl carrier protein